MCQAAGKLFGHYNAAGPTKAFLTELSAYIGIPISELVQSLKAETLDIRVLGCIPRSRFISDNGCLQNLPFRSLDGFMIDIYGRIPRAFRTICAAMLRISETFLTVTFPFSMRSPSP